MVLLTERVVHTNLGPGAPRWPGCGRVVAIVRIASGELPLIRYQGRMVCLRLSNVWWSSKNAESQDSDCRAKTVW